MKLKRLLIRRNDFGPSEGAITGQIEFDGLTGAIALNLSPEQCRALLSVVGDSLVSVAKDAAQNLAIECAVSVPATGAQSITK